VIQTTPRENIRQDPGQKTSAPSPDQRAAEPTLEARRVGVRYAGADRPALRDVSMRLRPGERVALIGPSGGGKTTLLRALEGSVNVSEGSVRRSGKAVLIYQDLRLVAEQTVLDNVCAGASGELSGLQGLITFPASIRQRATELLNDLGLAACADRRLGTLSGGQRQRVAIARALCARPGVLLADEPMGALDPDNAARILTMLARLQAKHGYALVVSMHDPGPDPGFFDRFLVVEKGELVRDCSDAEEAWSVFAAPRGRSGLVSEAASDPSAPAQDSAPERLASWSDRAWQAFGWLLLAGLVFSFIQIDTVGASTGGTWQNLRDFAGRMLPESWQAARELPWGRLGASLLETIYMALIGTTLGILLSLPMAVLGASGISPGWLRVPVRFVLNVLRTVPSIFWALFFVIIVGLGPVAGVLALAAYSVGYLTKFFYEALEDTDARPAEALRALGANRAQVFFRGIFPAARPALAGACLFVLEYNVRGASVLGIVGAGGIGQDLMYYIEWRNFPAAIAGLLLILVVVVLLDAASQRWRARLASARGA